MKKRFLIIAVGLISSFLYAEYRPFSFSVEPVYGLMNGKIEESVTYFDDDVRTYESRLDWDIKNVQMYGADLSFDLLKFINMNIYTVQGISGSSGFMQDYDWLNPFEYAWRNDDPAELTNYSKHQNTLDYYGKSSFSLGVNLYLPAKITLIPKVSYASEYIKMTGSGGYYEYKTYNWEKKYFEDDAAVISYEQSLSFFLFGLSLKIKTIPHAFINLDFSIAPGNCMIEALDTHIVRNIKFNDKLYKSIDLESSAKAFFMFNDNLGLGVKGNIQYIPDTFGADWVGYGSYWSKATEEGGTNRFLWTIQISGIYRF